MKTEKIDGAHGEFLLVQWDAPNTPRLVYPPGDASIQLDMNAFDQYQVYWATDSQTFFDFERPNEEGWGFELIPNGAIRHPFLEEAPGFCYWPDANLTNTTGDGGNMLGGLDLSPAASTLGVDGKPVEAEPFDPNATVPGPVNTNCIMDTDCGIRGNGVPAYIKVKRNWESEAKGLALIREICKWNFFEQTNDYFISSVSSLFLSFSLSFSLSLFLSLFAWCFSHAIPSARHLSWDSNAVHNSQSHDTLLF